MISVQINNWYGYKEQGEKNNDVHRAESGQEVWFISVLAGELECSIAFWECIQVQVAIMYRQYLVTLFTEYEKYTVGGNI